jgi:acetyl esterase/lipase
VADRALISNLEDSPDKGQPMKTKMDRRGFLSVGVATATGLWLADQAAAAEADFVMKTFTYKTVGKLKIEADVYRPDDDIVRPVVVWIHGGALINGHRAGVSRRVKTWAQNAGYAIVSIDYRLAPETQLPEIVKDLEDAFSWIHEAGPRLFKIDPTKIAVAGGSAGGYLTLTSGFRVTPRPKVLLSFWGYGDLVGDWYSKPSPHPRHYGTKLSRADAYRQVSGPPVSDSRERKGNGGAFYQFCRQQGEWPKAVSGWDPLNDPEKFYPYMAVKNVTSKYPPTVMIHGTKDTDVPYEQSVMMAAELKKEAVPHKLLSIKGGEHGLGGGDPVAISAAYQQAFAFVDKHLMR